MTNFDVGLLQTNERLVLQGAIIHRPSSSIAEHFPNVAESMLSAKKRIFVTSSNNKSLSLKAQTVLVNEIQLRKMQ